MKKADILAKGPQGKMTMVSGMEYRILFDNGVYFDSPNSREQRKLYDKLMRLGFERHYNFSSDEMDGLVQASLNGENPFACTTISTLNK